MKNQTKKFIKIKNCDNFPFLAFVVNNTIQYCVVRLKETNTKDILQYWNNQSAFLKIQFYRFLWYLFLFSSKMFLSVEKWNFQRNFRDQNLYLRKQCTFYSLDFADSLLTIFFTFVLVERIPFFRWKVFWIKRIKNCFDWLTFSLNFKQKNWSDWILLVTKKEGRGTR